MVCSTLIVWWHSPPRPPLPPPIPKKDDVFQRRSGQDKSKIVNVRRGSPLIIQRWRQFWWIHSWNAAHRIGLFPIPTRPHSVQSLDTISSLDLINLYCTWQLCYLPDCLPILFPKYPWQVFPICHPYIKVAELDEAARHNWKLSARSISSITLFTHNTCPACSCNCSPLSYNFQLIYTSRLSCYPSVYLYLIWQDSLISINCTSPSHCSNRRCLSSILFPEFDGGPLLYSSGCEGNYDFPQIISQQYFDGD